MKYLARRDRCQASRIASIPSTLSLVFFVVLSAAPARGDDDRRDAPPREAETKTMGADDRSLAKHLEEWEKIDELPIVNGRKVVKKSLIDSDEYALDNAFLSLLGSDDDLLTPVQRPAHLAFLYDGEVQNGGHLQYFTNLTIDRGAGAIPRIEETIRSLSELGAAAQADILTRALARWSAKTRKMAASVKDYSSLAMEGEFDDLDHEYYISPVETAKILRSYFREHEADFIVRE